MNDNIENLDRPRICYLLDNEKPLEVGEKFNVPNCSYNPYYINASGRIVNHSGVYFGIYEANIVLDCINGKLHIQRLPQYPDFSDTEVKALKWFHKHFGTGLKAWVDGETAVFSSCKVTLVPATLFPHLKEYTQGNPFDMDAYLKWREEDNAN